jgi:hypothetical protein
MFKSVKKETVETIKEKEVLKLSNDNKAKVVTENYYIECLLIIFKEQKKPSENILVAIQHLEALQKLLLKEAEGIEIVDAEIVE